MRGTMKEFAKKFYKSKEWKHVREQVMTRDGRLCQDCLKQGRIVPAEEVHHIIELTQHNITDPAISLNFDNLVALCRECHRGRHNSAGVRYEPRYTVDQFGNVTIADAPQGR